MFQKKNFLVIGVGIVSVYLGLRYIYFGSIVRDCIYTEHEIQMKPGMITGKLLFVDSAAIITESYQPYECVPGFKSIKNQIVQSKYAIKHDDGSPVDPQKIKYVDANSKIELQPVRLLAVSKHGITTIDSGGGPILHLILKDQEGTFYQVPTVYLGINKGEEFLELNRSDGTKELLSADSELGGQ